MIAVVFTGSKYADWRLADKNRVISGFRMPGINPYLQDERTINQILHKNTNLINHAEQIKKIFFFGAGSSSLERQDKIKRVFERFFVNAKVKVEHDMIASSIATFGDEKGITAILGSGSNAAYYTGKKNIVNNLGLGYILADEGSSNWLGRMLLKDFVTNKLPVDIREKMNAKFNLDQKLILEKVYNAPSPTNFLTSFADFLLENKENIYIKNLVKKGLRSFFEVYIKPLADQYPNEKINFTGSIAHAYEDWLREIAQQEYSLQIGLILKEPIHNLTKYYINKI